jgi:tetratricopeptide (TPR) repeat protein
MKMNAFKLLVLICFVCVSTLFFTLPGFAENGTIRVKCVDSASNPIAGADVTVSPLSNPKPKLKKSDSKGVAEFVALDDGGYRVFARQDGFEPALFEFVVLKGFKPTETVTLKLVAGPDKALYFEDPDLGKKTLDLLKQAINFVKEDKFDEAEKLLKQVIEIDPANSDAFRLLGGLFLQQSKFEEAETALKKSANILTIVTAAPLQTQSQQLLDLVQLTLKQMPGFKAKSALAQGDFDQAITGFTQVLQVDPNNSEWHFYKAFALLKSDKIDEALVSINKAIELKPDEKRYEELKGQMSAQSQYDKMKALQSEGNKLLESGDDAGALKKYEELRALVPQDKQGPIWRQIGKVQAKLNRPDAAVQSFKKAIELASDEKTASEYRKSLAQFYLDQQKYDDAVNVLADSKGADPQNIEQTLFSIFTSFKEKEPQFAESVLERILTINPQNADVYFELGQLYYLDGKAKDNRTKELLAKYIQIGKDQDKLKRANDLLVVISRRNSAKVNPGK